MGSKKVLPIKFPQNCQKIKIQFLKKSGKGPSRKEIKIQIIFRIFLAILWREKYLNTNVLLKSDKYD